MLDRNYSVVARVALAVFVLLLGAADAAAYVGPGVDVNFIGQFMALLWFAAAACSAVMLWPVYALLRWLLGRRSQAEADKSITAPEQTQAAGRNDPEHRLADAETPS